MPLGPSAAGDAASDTTEDDDAASDVTSQLEREQERFRRLFGVFDANQDGFLDKSDLERMCRQLGLDEQAVPLILSQLGADHRGQVSCDDFLRAWIELRTEVERLRAPAPAGHTGDTGDSQPPAAHADTPLGDCVSWSSGVTSGDPTDPALQPDSLLVLLERAGHDTAGQQPDLLAAADQVHQAAVAALRSELAVTAARLAQVTEENSQLQRTLSSALRERSRGERAAAERYEQRLVELHSVLAELTRKLQRQRAAAIAEEDEDEEDEDDEPGSDDLVPSSGPGSDFQPPPTAPEGPPAGLDQPATLAQPQPTEAGLDQPEILTQPSGQNVSEAAVEAAPPAHRYRAADSADKACQMTEPQAEQEHQLTRPDAETAPDASGDPAPSPTGAALSPASSPARPSPAAGRRQGLERQIHSLAKENDRLQERLGRQEAEINRCRITTESAAEERDRLRRQLLEYRRLVECASPRSGRSGRSGGSAGPSAAASPQPAGRGSPAAVPRMAERVRLRQTSCSGAVTGSDISACGVQSTRVAEHLVRAYCSGSAAQEALQAAGGGLQERLLLAELEADRLRARLEHAQSQVDGLTLSLEAACAQSEHLAALCGKYESNCVALQLAAEAADQLTEAFDLLVALQDSELALLLASCRAAGLGLAAGRSPPADAETALRVASEQRRSCENVARHALSRLERRAAAASEGGSQNTSTTSSSSSGVDVDVCRSDETRVRQHIQRLKVERALVCRTTVQLESTCHPPPAPRPLSPAAAQRLDLEHAVLVQELMALREDRAELRSRLFLVERERAGLELQLASRAASEQAYRVQLQQLRERQATDEDQAAEACGEAGDAAGRQTALRQLSASLDEVTRTAEQRQQHADQFIAELKRANGALADALEKTKRKYQAKLKRLEQQMLQIVEHHSRQQPPAVSSGPAPEDDQPCPRPAPPSAGRRPSPVAPAGSRLPVMSPGHRSPLAAAPRRTAPPVAQRPPPADRPR